MTASGDFKRTEEILRFVIKSLKGVDSKTYQSHCQYIKEMSEKEGVHKEKWVWTQDDDLKLLKRHHLVQNIGVDKSIVEHRKTFLGLMK